MNSFLFRSAVAIFGFVSSYLSFGQKAHADDWGCQVILCLSNPGGPMQYGECRPPVRIPTIARIHSNLMPRIIPI